MINKDNILKRIIKKEDKILVKNVIDKYLKYEKTGINTYTNFLDLRQYKLVTDVLKSEKISYNTYKVCDECEKVIIYFGSYDNYVTIYSFESHDVKHKDVLGTLFSLGYNIDTIGDIFVNNDYVYFTNLSRLNPFLETNLYMIKNNRIELKKVDSIILNDDRFISLKIVISSYRLDVIVSKLGHLSRSDSIKYINDGLVLLNYEEVKNKNKLVNIGDIISIRKIGKFKIENELLKSKKDNYLIDVKKYN